MQSAPPVTKAKAKAEAPRRRSMPPIEKRARSVPYKKPYVMAVIISALFYLGLVGTTSALFAFMVVPGQSTASLLVGLGAFSTFLWLFSFFKRRSCFCPLCKGTPLLDSAARRHEKAVRFFPLTYGTSNVIRLLMHQRFRCQFCGTPFDLLKPLTSHSAGHFQPTPGHYRSNPPIPSAGVIDKQGVPRPASPRQAFRRFYLRNHRHRRPALSRRSTLYAAGSEL